MAEILISREDCLRIEKAIAEQRSRHAGRDRDDLVRLEGELNRAKKVAAEDLSADVVALDREVTMIDLADDSEETYRLVLPDKADVSRLRISVLAPSEPRCWAIAKATKSSGLFRTACAICASSA
jgi:regulator of nucleoside diphosphate kinase